MAHRISAEIIQNDRQSTSQSVSLSQVPISGIGAPGDPLFDGSFSGNAGGALKLDADTSRLLWLVGGLAVIVAVTTVRRRTTDRSRSK
jgi:hypothetical protein